MGKTKKTQIFCGLFFGILMWVFGILLTGFLPTPGDGIEFGIASALPIIYPAVLWAVCIFLGIKTAKNGKSAFLFSYIIILLIPTVSSLFTFLFGELALITNINIFDALAASFSFIAVPFIGSVIYGADIAFMKIGINMGSGGFFDDFLFYLFVIIAAMAPIAGIVARRTAKKS